MSTIEQNVNVNENLDVSNNAAVKVSMLDKILEKRDKPKPDAKENKENSEIKPKKEKEVVNPIKTQEPKDLEEKKVSEEKEIKADEEIKNKASNKKISDTKEDDDERDLELTKLRKALNDSQKWGHNNNRRLKNVSKIVNSLKEAGTLTDEEFNDISNLLVTDLEPEIEADNVNADPIENFMQLANERIGDLQEIYEDDKLFNKKAQAFTFFARNCSPQEKADLLDELEEIGKNPLKLAKRMYQIGDKYYNENYKELDEAGGLKELITIKNDEIKRLHRKIDKLEKKVLESNDYDEPTNKIDELSDTLPESELSTHKPNDVMGGFLDRRDRKKR